MGLSLKKLGNLAGKAVGAASGALFGGPTGAVAGFNGADAVLGAVGLGDDQLAAEENWNLQKKAADYKYQQDLNMWNLVNAYNDPAAQMERLQNAGLNPNLVYGGGNVTGNTSGSSPEYAGINAGYTDRSIQRKQLAMAMTDHQQRITNQAIQNDLARQELALRMRASQREDEKLSLLKNRMANLTLSSGDDIYDVDKVQRIYDHDYDMRVKQWKLAEQEHLKNLSIKQVIRHKMGLRNYDDDWYKKHPLPLREVHPAGHVRYYGRRV